MSNQIKSNELKSLRGRQVALVKRYALAMKDQNFSMLESLKDSFLENFDTEKRVDTTQMIEVGRYPLFFDNIFQGLGFKVYMGDLPTLSGTQPWDVFHVALDASRMIVIGDQPSTVLANIADVQPLSSKPILGVSHVTWCGKRNTSWEDRYSKLSTALGIGRLQILDPDLLKEGMKLDPKNDVEKIKDLANKIGLTNFLSLPVDNLPIYGTFRTQQRQLPFTEKNVKKMLVSAKERGHQLASGVITNIDPEDALNNPKKLLDELNHKDCITGNNEIMITEFGEHYIETNLISTAQEAALLKVSDMSIMSAIRTEFSNFESRLYNKIDNSTDKIIDSIDVIKFEIKEINKDRVRAKYVIETPSLIPIKIQLEIPIGDMKEEEILLKIVEIKSKIATIPLKLTNELMNTIRTLEKVPENIKKRLLTAFKK